MSPCAPDLALGVLRDLVIPRGANLSKHGRQTAAVAARTGPGVVLVHATGSAGTQADLIPGPEGMRGGILVPGTGVRAPKNKHEESIQGLAAATAEHLGIPGAVSRESVRTGCDYACQGNGLPAERMADAVAMLARTEAVLLDPVYSDKDMAGLMDLRREGYSQKGENVVLLHTGGSIGLFGCTGAFDAVMPA